jgi:hypothetical protein
MVQIRSTKPFKTVYAVTDSQGFVTEWRGRFGREGVQGVIDGETHSVRKDGGKRFVFEAGDRELASAQQAGRAGRTWNVQVGDEAYELTRASWWRSSFELRRAGNALGTISRKRRNTLIELPDELSTSVQAFLGFLAMAIWNREAAAATAGSTAAGV